MPIRANNFFLTVQNRIIEIQRLNTGGNNQPTIVFLHEGLGSIAAWRDFPSRVAEAANCEAVLYSRYGYGNSDVWTEPPAIDYMHCEARLVLPELLVKLSIRKPILLGHSDGASIALIYAGLFPDLQGLILLAPHVFVEEMCISGIVALKRAFETTGIASELSTYHRDSAATFRGWSDIWLNPEFRCWNIESYLSNIACPLLAIQGLDDQYGTLQQLDTISRLVKGPVTRLHLENCRHSPHRDQPAKVLEAIESFVAKIT